MCTLTISKSTIVNDQQETYERDFVSKMFLLFLCYKSVIDIKRDLLPIYALKRCGFLLYLKKNEKYLTNFAKLIFSQIL